MYNEKFTMYSFSYQNSRIILTSALICEICGKLPVCIAHRKFKY